jgi:hypothetical protein
VILKWHSWHRKAALLLPAMLRRAALSCRADFDRIHAEIDGILAPVMDSRLP